MMLTRWEPRGLGTLRTEMDRLFDHFVGNEPRPRDDWFRPALEVAEDVDSLTVKVELPGVDKEKIDVKIDGPQLTISGSKEEKRDEGDKSYHVYEARYGSFQRTLHLPETIDTAKSEADYTDGVLTITFAKKEESKPRKLEIKLK